MCTKQAFTKHLDSDSSGTVLLFVKVQSYIVSDTAQTTISVSHIGTTLMARTVACVCMCVCSDMYAADICLLGGRCLCCVWEREG